MPVSGRPALVYRRPFASIPVWKPRPPTEKPIPDLLRLIVRTGRILMRRWKRKPMRSTSTLRLKSVSRLSVRHLKSADHYSVAVAINDSFLGGCRMPAQQDLRHRIDLVVVGAVRELRALFEKIRYPGKHLRMRQIDVPRFDQRADRAGDLSTGWVHRNDTGNLIHQHLDDGCTVGLVLDQLGRRAPPLRGKLGDPFDRCRTIHSLPDLIEQQELGAKPSPNLPDHIVRSLQILESAVPRLGLFLHLADLLSHDQSLSAIR